MMHRFPQQKSERRRYAPWLRLAFLLTLLCLISGSTLLAQEEPQASSQVRTLRASKATPADPRGVAYAAGHFLVVEQSPAGALTLVALTPYERVEGTRLLAVTGAVQALAADENGGRLFVLQGGNISQLPLGDQSAAEARDLDSSFLELEQATGLAVDPANGALLVLDAARRQIMRAPLQPDGSLDAAGVSRVDLAHLNASDLRGLALNPLNNHLYLLDATQQLVYEVDRAGAFVASYDLAPLQLTDPRDLAFAPSAHVQDGSDAVHLYIADGRAPSPDKPAPADAAPATGPNRLFLPLLLSESGFPGDAGFSGDTEEDIDPALAAVAPAGKIVEVALGNASASANEATLSAAQINALVSGPILGSDTTTIRRPDSYGKPNQSRIWYNSAQGRWDALIPLNDGGGVSASDHYILKDVPGSQTFTDVELVDRDFARPDIFWDEASQTLYVLASHPVQSQFWRVGYSAASDSYAIEVGAPGTGVEVPGITHPNNDFGGNSPASLYATPNGHVWVAVMKDGGLEVQHSGGRRRHLAGRARQSGRRRAAGRHHLDRL